MPMQTLSGTATKVVLGSHQGFAPTAQYGPVAVKMQLATFRLNGRPVRIKVHESASISEGDQLIAAGHDKQGTLEALAVRNLTTGAIHYIPYQFPLYGGLVALILSIPMIFILIGLLLAPIAAWVTWRGWQIKSAVTMVSSAPIGQVATA
jgi:hypothetical protein